MTYVEFSRERHQARYAVGKGRFRGAAETTEIELVLSRATTSQISDAFYDGPSV